MWACVDHASRVECVDQGGSFRSIAEYHTSSTVGEREQTSIARTGSRAAFTGYLSASSSLLPPAGAEPGSAAAVKIPGLRAATA